MKKAKDLFWNASLENLKKGYVFDSASDTYSCLICGEKFSRGMIYSLGEGLYEAWKAVERHLELQHPPMFEYLLELDKELTGLTDHQKKILSYFYHGLSDKEIAEALDTSASTVRNHRFAFREKKKQAKVVLAMMELWQEKGSGEGIKIPENQSPAKLDNNNNAADEKSYSILQKYFRQGLAGPLSKFPNREKTRYAIVRHLAERFASDAVYTEKEINDILQEIYPDYAILRRYLIDYRFLSRNPEGSSYWVTKTQENNKGVLIMDKEEKNRIKSEYKLTVPAMGIFQIRCLNNGKILVGSSPNLAGKSNSYAHMLEWEGLHNKELGADLKKYGQDNFVFEILEELEPDKENPHRSYHEDLKALEQLWLEKLEPYGEKGYNRKSSK